MRISRRHLIGSAGATVASGVLAQVPEQPTPLRLRVLATSDLHMFALDWDYYRARPEPTVGLNKVAALIAQARHEAANVVLLDNGDLIQGNPLGDYVAAKRKLHPGESSPNLHPMIRALNDLRYDAATLGNHEFNYGLDFLHAVLAGAKFPFVCANFQNADGSTYLPPFHVLERSFVDEAGHAQPLRIGVIGFVPPQIMTWDKSHLDGRAICGDILESARRFVPLVRKDCDVLIALCHSGISTSPMLTGEENASFHLAAIPGIDAIIMGHSHRVFPGPDYEGRPGVDALRGTLAGVPAVMPGFWGSHLGLIDLTLTRDGGRWRVGDFRSEARPIARRDGSKVVSLVEGEKSVAASIEPDHSETLAWVEQPVGVFAEPVHSYFVWAGYDPAGAIVNAAQTSYAKQLLSGTEHRDVPVLSAAAPFKAGYTPDFYVDIKAGKVALREVADLYVFANTLTAVRLSGAMVREWLEYAVRLFNRIDPAVATSQVLMDRRVPSYNFDAISGVSYQIDLTQPSRYDQNGRVIHPDAHRIADLSFAGTPIDVNQDFIVVTNNYRADGGGKFPGLDGRNIVLRAPDTNRDTVIRYISEAAAPVRPGRAPWTFKRFGQGVTVSFESANAAASHVGEIAGLSYVGPASEGYSKYELKLD
ncbi:MULTISPECIES: bifunctional 2',3'-cyclic-nucleotide 2'-phosphodiesterase/3'-nucleotidase [unclassified Beijerinckia]|uniref:bifunctional 2',3'-cyclic-nucleotide 2'-phosphodiesterase/3'-nucleotidase n=1 Tax=unclassified Beijerinckia TaxID=2638183 RepID=UPI00089A7C42|nr:MULTISPECIES: bifunctional 2',3'-cyclic-nucleotide 2'-phosphodiesterase/3'-nucleotidase [unclassified Beijerinckia]MDH7794500.1 2',3'-cyclic-nucleotide 2'-phosphodiesterase/3'-nucleotidase [Beijerinckia sp. GAS462]SEB64481.1 2',3'-cyclic-nucleotide 2'-phosphodiesterase / 3'-nucleotidase [Beijerinckia sp. 28-YEA-48]